MDLHSIKSSQLWLRVSLGINALISAATDEILASTVLDKLVDSANADNAALAQAIASVDKDSFFLVLVFDAAAS